MPRSRLNKIARFINQIYVFLDFVSPLFHTPDLMRYLINNRSLQGEA